jgi:hypothetical protein
MMAAIDCAYVIGAGFSAGLGYPLTHDLLLRLWQRIDGKLKEDLRKVISFHHPGFDPNRFSSFPNVEQLLSEMAVNEELFNASRQYDGSFTKEDLQRLQRDLLLQVADWFHELSHTPHVDEARERWLKQFRARVIDEGAIIISFNWDLILDHLFFEDSLDRSSYGFSGKRSGGPILLKPHGSLNWFEGNLANYIKEEKRTLVHQEDGQEVHAFLYLSRAPTSERGRVYFPLIIPPIYLKKFDKPVFHALWRNCTSVLSRAKKVIFLGYSMPLADLHAQFILRCGFHNQVEGELGRGGKRKPATGAANVIIVNPDKGAADRTAMIAGGQAKCRWISRPVAEWIAERAR